MNITLVARRAFAGLSLGLAVAAASAQTYRYQGIAKAVKVQPQ